MEHALRSPFPGMDPYLERSWDDVHHELVTLTRTTLNRSLPDALVARVDERRVIDHIDYSRVKVIYPDGRVDTDPEHAPPVAAESLQGPLILKCETQDHIELYVKITERQTERFITAIEFVSPSSKRPGEAQDGYRRWRSDLLRQAASFVEIDLNRTGSWKDLLRPFGAWAKIETAYRVTVRHPHRPDEVDFFPIALRRRLPAIPISLRLGDAPAVLELQPLVDAIYANGKYLRMDYRSPCEPPLGPDDAAWADELLKRWAGDKA